ncbi:DUF1800 domain-containing protein [Sanyastnella coralliicola]|uniref:DUF1800 domain-containing protein n=1 Tax=Sanyastnella coralliicola TaxID=3069118 RepID=UPI0027B8CBFA|nr:DUF1800 domain-containing protein [Longitalea sp. SCSIO 12813]
MKYSLLAAMALWCLSAQSQIFQDHFGAGQDNGVTVTSSSQSNGTSHQATINGLGLNQHLKDASRFLGQASLGADYELIQDVASVGPEFWMEQQFEAPLVSFRDTMDMVWNDFLQQYYDIYGEEEVYENPNIFPLSIYWRQAWWHNVMHSEDQLRQRIALALSEIFVVSERSDLEIAGHGLAAYYDMLYQNSFGNFRDLIEDVTMHPVMGYYLSHLNNERTDEENNIQPDENYAREVMQLFTIGLYELNNDGSIQFDDDNEPIASYDNDDIQEFAKIFTGLAPAEYWWHWDDISDIPVQWDGEFNTIPTINTWLPMEINEAWHEPGEKYLLNGQVVPSGQSGAEDISDAMDNLFNHPNVGPFIGKQLIQRLVKSNPSPEYVSRVADAFNDNGEGVRGDMKAVIRQVLLDPEARDCEWIELPSSGKMREPMIRMTQILRAFDAANESGDMWAVGGWYQEATYQSPLGAPSVFNFFLPSHSPHGPIFDEGLVAPEFEILTSATAINYVNLVYFMFLGDFYLDVSTEASENNIGFPEFNWDLLAEEDRVDLDLSDEVLLSTQGEVLMDRLDILLTGGTMSDETKEEIGDAVELMALFDDEAAVKAGIFLTLISPDYVIQK